MRLVLVVLSLITAAAVGFMAMAKAESDDSICGADDSKTTASTTAAAAKKAEKLTLRGASLLLVDMFTGKYIYDLIVRYRSKAKGVKSS